MQYCEDEIVELAKEEVVAGNDNTAEDWRKTMEKSLC